jgi:glycosyltransferase involved in cell wall biosynthesis
MNIAYLIPSCGITGGVAVACQHTNRLMARGHEVSFISETLETNLDWFPGQKVKVLPLEKYPDDVDILVATGWTTSFTAVKLPARQKFYFVQSDETRFHEPDSIWQKITALSYNLNFNYFTEAKWIQEWLNVGFGHDAALIPNGLDQTIFYPDDPLAPSGERPRILLEGAIDIPYKGMEDAFNVVKDLDAEIWCVSTLGKPKPEWHCDRFFGQVSMEQMRRIYSSCDILLKMSRVEGFFGPPLEMMACGGAVVVGKVTGYEEYIKDGYNALVVEQGDIIQARESIKRIINDRGLQEKLINSGFETVKEWDWDTSINKLESNFRNILEKNPYYGQSSSTLMSDQGIALSYEMAKQQHINYNHLETSAFTEPVDRLLFRLRRSKVMKVFANFIYKVYKFLKRTR